MLKYLNDLNNNDFIKRKENNIYNFFNLDTFYIFIFFRDLINHGGLTNGYKLGGDSEFYISETNKLINGNSFKNLSRLGFYFILAPFLYFNIPLIWFVFFQITVSATAGLCLYKITSVYYSKFSGLICLILFLFYIPIQIRNYYILTDILFIDISIISTYFIFFFKKFFTINNNFSYFSRFI